MVKESEKIYTTEIVMVFSSTLLATFFGIGSYIMYNQSAQDAFWAAIIGAILSFIVFYIVCYIFNNNSENTIFELCRSLFGKVFGNILNILMILTIFILTCVILFNMASFLNLEYLPDSSVNMIEALLLLTTVYVCSKRLPQILRVNQIFVFVCMFNIIINVIGLFPKFDIRNLEPVFVASKIDFIKSVFTYVVLSIIAYFTLLLTSRAKIADKKILNKRMIISVVTTHIVLIGIILLTILLLGKEYISMFRYPEYIGLKQFGLFNMIERIENILSLQLYFNAFSLLMFLIYFIKSYLPSNKYVKYYPVLITSAIYFVTILLFKDSMTFINLVEKYIAYVILGGLMLPITLIFVKLHFFTKLPK